MPKSRKQRTEARKKTRPRTRRRKINEDVPIIPLLESTTEEGTHSEVAVDDSIAAPGLSSEIRMEDYAGVSEERASIISIVKGLEEQVETAFKLKDVLQAELDVTQKKLSEELSARAELDARVESLEIQAALAGQLREDISFAEEERNKFANLLAETQSQLEAVTEERDLLTEKMASAEAHAKELEDGKTALEAQVMNLKDKVADMDHMRGELAEVTEAHRDLAEQVRDLSSRLEASDTSKNTLERDLTEANEEVENLRERLTSADNQVADLRVQLEEQQAANRGLIETKTRLENEMGMLNINHKAAKNELEAFKKALRDIRNEATRTSGRVRQRYFKPKAKE